MQSFGWMNVALGVLGVLMLLGSMITLWKPELVWNQAHDKPSAENPSKPTPKWYLIQRLSSIQGIVLAITFFLLMIDSISTVRNFFVFYIGLSLLGIALIIWQIVLSRQPG